MTQELRFRVDLGQLALLKKREKIWADYEQLFMPVFKGIKKSNIIFFQKFYRLRNIFNCGTFWPLTLPEMGKGAHFSHPPPTPLL